MFQIDFFELLFLAEACIPPQPIARMVFWDKLLTTHYERLTPAERQQMFTYITENGRFSNSDDDCQWFYARYNPNNQYVVRTEHEGRRQTIKAFRKDDRFWTTPKQFIAPQYVVSWEPAQKKHGISTGPHSPNFKIV